jgi:16S rRNA (guanine966-N2)-methyltransferase
VTRLRIIAGRLKGRRIDPPTWKGLRPTSDKLRETLFNVLAPRMAGARVLDGYAGTGAVGLEAISRGASHVTFVERDRRAQRLIAGNIVRCGIADGYVIIGSTVLQAIEALSGEPPFDVVMLDPPYAGPRAPSGELSDIGRDIHDIDDVHDIHDVHHGDDVNDVLGAVGAIVRADGVVVLEHARKRPPPAAAGTLVRLRELTSGDSALTFYACQP